MIKVALVGGLIAATTTGWWKQVNNAGFVMTGRKEMLSALCFTPTSGSHPIWHLPLIGYDRQRYYWSDYCGVELVNPEGDDKTFIIKVVLVGRLLVTTTAMIVEASWLNTMLDVWWEEGNVVSQADVSWITLYVPAIGVAGVNIRSSVTNSLKL